MSAPFFTHWLKVIGFGAMWRGVLVLVGLGITIGLIIAKGWQWAKEQYMLREYGLKPGWVPA